MRAAARTSRPCSAVVTQDRKSTRLNSSHLVISYAAFCLKKKQNRHWRLGVHISDVSHFAKPKPLFEREAHNRATTVDVPDRCIPMLHEVISHNLARSRPN